MPSKVKYRLLYSASQKFLVGKKFNFFETCYLILSNVPSLFEGLIRNVPGTFGYVIRRFYYRFRLLHLGKSSLIDVGVHFNGPRNIVIGDFTWIDVGVKLEATLGFIEIGSRIHIAPYVVIGAREKITIEDYAAIAAGSKIYSNSETPQEGLRMSGPMIPESEKAFISKPICIGRDSVVGTNSVLLPGANLGRGAVLGALSLLNRSVPEWEIWAGHPAKKISMRKPIGLN